MADSKISALPASTTPLAGTEVLPVVQSSTTKQVSVANLTAGRVVSGSKFSPTGNNATGNGMYLPTTSQLAWSVNSTEYLRLTTTGFGIGTSTPGALLDISAAAGSNTQYFTAIDATGGGVTGSIGFRAAYTVGGTRYEHARIWATSTLGSLDVGSLIFGTASGAVTERLRIASTGNITFSTGNVIQGTAAKGVDFSANTPAAGKTSTLLNWYEEGTWTPNQGAGLTVVGAFSSTGRYTRIGRQVSISGTVTGATSVAVTAAGVITSNLPFTVVTAGHGDATNVAINASATVICTGTSVTSAAAIAATATITFSATYFV